VSSHPIFKWLALLKAHPDPKALETFGSHRSLRLRQRTFGNPTRHRQGLTKLNLQTPLHLINYAALQR